jgi:hypothetical protein
LSQLVFPSASFRFQHFTFRYRVEGDRLYHNIETMPTRFWICHPRRTSPGARPAGKDERC